MKDYARQDWHRQPDPDTVRDNEFAGICVGAMLGILICSLVWWAS